MPATKGTLTGTPDRARHRPPCAAAISAAILGGWLLLAAASPASMAQTRQPRATQPAGPQSSGHQLQGTPVPGMKIVAVVNGDVITSGDVENRARLFALSTGLPTTGEVIERLKTQIANQLVDEKLRLQEGQRRKIVVPDKQIAGAIHDIEQRNNMPEGAMRQRLAGLGVSVRTLIDQIRVQLAWTQVLREQLADKMNISDTEIDEQMRLHERQLGKPEYRVGEIFIPVDDPVNISDAQRFA
jgi:peptidyl-prolyl cis-trans isomerase SurA